MNLPSKIILEAIQKYWDEASKAKYKALIDEVRRDLKTPKDNPSGDCAIVSYELWKRIGSKDWAVYSVYMGNPNDGADEHVLLVNKQGLIIDPTVDQFYSSSDDRNEMFGYKGYGDYKHFYKIPRKQLEFIQQEMEETLARRNRGAKR